MKKLNLMVKLACLALVSFAVVSCGGGAKNTYLNSLPSDAYMVMGVNFHSLAQKAYNNDPALSPFGQLGDLMNQSDMPYEVRQLMEAVKDPSKAGIDPEADIFIFINMTPGTSRYSSPNVEVGMLAKMSNKSDFEKFITGISVDDPAQVVEGEGYSRVTFPNESDDIPALIFNNDAALMLFNPDDNAGVLTKAQALLAQKRENSLMANNDIAAHIEGGNDGIMVVNMSGMDALGAQFTAMMPSFWNYMKEMSVAVTTNFENGKITGGAHTIYKTAEARNEIQKLQQMNLKLSGNLTRMVPETSPLVIAGGLRGSEMYSYLSSIPTFAMALAYVPQAKQVMEGIEGDFLLYMTGVGPYGIPQLALLCEVKDEDVLESLIAQFGGMLQLNKVADRQYAFNMDGINVNFGVKDKVLYATNSPEVMQALAGENINSLAGKYNHVFKGSYGSIFLDFRNVYALLEASGVIAEGGMEAALGVAFVQLFETTEMWTTTPTEGRYDITMTDKNTNAAKVIYDKLINVVKLVARENM